MDMLGTRTLFTVYMLKKLFRKLIIFLYRKKVFCLFIHVQSNLFKTIVISTKSYCRTDPERIRATDIRSSGIESLNQPCIARRADSSRYLQYGSCETAGAMADSKIRPQLWLCFDSIAPFYIVN